jgi:hypothetical protein
MVLLLCVLNVRLLSSDDDAFLPGCSQLSVLKQPTITCEFEHNACIVGVHRAFIAAKSYG